jgi:hypothetical protein
LAALGSLRSVLPWAFFPKRGLFSACDPERSPAVVRDCSYPFIPTEQTLNCQRRSITALPKTRSPLASSRSSPTSPTSSSAGESAQDHLRPPTPQAHPGRTVRRPKLTRSRLSQVLRAPCPQERAPVSCYFAAVYCFCRGGLYVRPFGFIRCRSAIFVRASMRTAQTASDRPTRNATKHNAKTECERLAPKYCQNAAPGPG